MMISKSKFIKNLILCFLLTGLVLQVSVTDVSAAAKNKTYTITPKSAPINKKMKRYSFYNKYTRQYYTIRSYMELFEKKGGGTLVLKKGTYNITNTIFIPSNVTIKFSNGVVINKGKNTHVKGLKASNSLFHFVKPSKGLKKKVYGQYNSSKNIKMIGEGKAVIDMKFQKNSNCVEAGHNKNVLVQGLTFRNVHGGHFFELDANKNATIENCTFLNIKDAKNVREAINLDTPDKITGGFTAAWSKMDCTANENVTIKNCTFKNMPRAIGTHNYSGGHPHKNITVSDNTISNVKSYGIGIMYWHGAKITNNKITGAFARGKGKFDGILGYGAINNEVYGNVVKHFRYPILFKGYQDEHFKNYAKIWCTFTAKQLEMLSNNTGSDLAFDYAYVCENEKGSGTDKAFINITK